MLARQSLLERCPADVDTMLGRVAGLPAANANSPYVGLWSRLAGFRAEELVRCLDDRRVVRAPLFRATPHAVVAADWLEFRPLVQPVLERAFWIGSPYGRRLADVDVERLLAAARDLLAGGARSKTELAAALAERWPAHDPLALAQAVSLLLPVVLVPLDGEWGSGEEDRLTTTEAWLGRPPATEPSLARMVTRYLAAFGPATIEDVQSWSGRTNLRDVLHELRPALRVDRDEQGAELYDVPDAPRPAEDTPVPVRFLPEHDNVLVAHHDRSRIVSDADVGTLHRRGGGACRVALIGGHVRATWSITRERGAAILTIEPFGRLRRGDRRDLEDEGIRLLSFAANGADDYDVRVLAAS